jgi:hypothetical protein
MESFLQRHKGRVIGVLSGFDRVRLRGTLRHLAYVEGMREFLSRTGVLLKNFKEYMTGVTDEVRRATERTAAGAGRPVQYLASSASNKEEVARQIAVADKVASGLVCVLSCVELCRSYEIHRNRDTKHLELRNVPRKCLHYYFYYQHPRLGWLHARLQSWFPFDVRIVINGREWLCQELDRIGLGYRRRDNCLIDVHDVKRAQRVLDRQLRTNWPDLLNSIVRQVHPERRRIVERWPMDYYWSMDQSEWATDVMFRSASDLADLYPRLVGFAMSHFGTRDVLRFLGRRVPTTRGLYWGKFEGEATSDLHQRSEGMRVKHRVNDNSIKMYDKQGSVLRIETTINRPRDMKVFRPKEGDENGPKAWRYLRKGVADTQRRAELSQAANERYLEGLAAADDGKKLAEVSEPLCRATRWKGQRVRALNPLSAEDARLLEAVSRGEFLLTGFRNGDLQGLLYCKPAPPEERRRRSAAVTRQIRLLRAHGLIRKIPRTHRYRVSDRGRMALAALLAARQADTAKLTAAA